jgi:hypothetical protein
MLHACASRFNVTENLEKFLNKANHFFLSFIGCGPGCVVFVSLLDLDLSRRSPLQ